METYFISMGVAMILQMLKGKNKRKYRNVMLKVRNSINIAFADDPDFNPELNEEPF